MEMGCSKLEFPWGSLVSTLKLAWKGYGAVERVYFGL